MLREHEIALFNYMTALLPVVRDEFDTNYKDKASMEDYKWMPAVLNYEDEIGIMTSTAIDHGTMMPTPRREELKSRSLAQHPDAVTATVDKELFGEEFVVSDEYLFYADRKIHLTTDLRTRLRMWAETTLKRERAEALNLFANAFTTAGGYQTHEGKALCAADHHNQHDPAGFTYTNYLTHVLSWDALVVIDEDHTAMVGPDGQGVTFNFDTLVTGPGLRTTARTILESIGKPGGPNNDINLFQGGYRHVVIPDFQNAIIAGSQNWWFVMDSRQHSLFMKWGKTPTQSVGRSSNNRGISYWHDFDLVTNWYNPYGIVGSKGTYTPT